MNYNYKKYPGFEDYKILDDGKLECQICSKIIDSGISNIANHSIECVGIIYNFENTIETSRKLPNKLKN